MFTKRWHQTMDQDTDSTGNLSALLKQIPVKALKTKKYRFLITRLLVLQIILSTSS